jgi:hypothetical protein
MYVDSNRDLFTDPYLTNHAEQHSEHAKLNFLLQLPHTQTSASLLFGQSMQMTHRSSDKVTPAGKTADL